MELFGDYVVSISLRTSNVLFFGILYFVFWFYNLLVLFLYELF